MLYVVKFYLLHGWLKVKNGDGTIKYKEMSIPEKEISEDLVYDYQNLNFKIENIEVIYNYDESEVDSND